MKIKMTPKYFFFIMIAVNTLLVLALVGGVYQGNKMIQEQSNKLVEAKTQNKVIERQQIQLTQAKQDVQKYNDLNEISKSIVPQDKDQARTVREITKLANESGIKLKGITFTTSNLGEFTTPAPAPAPATPSEEGTAATPPVVAAPSITQVTPVEGINGVFAMSIVVNSLDTEPVPFDNFISFLEKLESNRRTAHVEDITVKPSDDGTAVSFVLTLNAYVKP